MFTVGYGLFPNAIWNISSHLFSAHKDEIQIIPLIFFHTVFFLTLCFLALKNFSFYSVIELLVECFCGRQRERIPLWSSLDDDW